MTFRRLSFVACVLLLGCGGSVDVAGDSGASDSAPGDFQDAATGDGDAAVDATAAGADSAADAAADGLVQPMYPADAPDGPDTPDAPDASRDGSLPFPDDALADSSPGEASLVDAPRDAAEDADANPDQDAGIGVCTPNQTMCSANAVTTCNADGLAWGYPVPCVNKACVSGACQGVCAPTATQCVGNGVQACDATGAWGQAVPCVGATCVNGACYSVCIPNQTKCVGNVSDTCNSTGNWDPPVTCTHQACINGTCTGVCSPGETRCSGGSVQICASWGAWSPADVCDGGCDGGTPCAEDASAD
jgi:hypothetical protein